jgi:hypothetical protein
VICILFMDKMHLIISISLLSTKKRVRAGNNIFHFKLDFFISISSIKKFSLNYMLDYHDDKFIFYFIHDKNLFIL